MNDNDNVQLLGDTHLGRKFLSNVPLHRRGDREDMIWHQFLQELQPKSSAIDTHIHMGDLFDKPVVSLDILLSTAMAYADAAKGNPKVQYYILRGNHDASRDLLITTAFEVFTKLVDHIPNITPVSGAKIVGDRLLFGWHPLISAADMVEAIPMFGYKTAYGHWDVDPRSDPFNLIPCEALSVRGVTEAFTGHIHKPDNFSRSEVNVSVVGSMQPFAWGEQANDDIYVEIPLIAIDTMDLTNKCVKVLLQPGEVFDKIVNCLQLTVIKAEEAAAENIDVNLGEFSLHKVFDETITDFPMPSVVEQQLRGKWQTVFAQQD